MPDSDAATAAMIAASGGWRGAPTEVGVSPTSIETMNQSLNFTPTAMKSARNLPLEGLRGFLAFSVLIFHLYEMGAKAGWYPEPVSSVLASSGVYIVCIFFCVSGYLIVQSLLLKANLLVFARNRIVRIYPVFFALHLVIFILGPLLHYAWMDSLRGHLGKWVLSFLSNLFFLPGVLNLPIAQKNAWSLSYEALFYICAALLIFAIRRRAHSLTMIFAISCILLIVWRPLCIFFVIGYLAYLLERRRLIHKQWLGWLAIPSLLVGVWVFPIHPFAAVLPVFVLFYCVVSGLGFAARWLSSPPLLFLGRISFSLYLVHPFAIDPVRWLLLHLGLHHHVLCAIVFPLAGGAVALACSVLSHSLIEQRLTRRLLHRAENDRVQRA